MQIGENCSLMDEIEGLCGKSTEETVAFPKTLTIMASRRERDFRRYHRQYESKTAWPYPTSRPTFQRNQWAGGDDNSSLETRLIDSPVNIQNCHVDFELVNSSSEICYNKYRGKAPVIVFKPDESEPSSQFVQSHSSKCSPVTSSPSL
ncbi:hypothetical protein J437_LFUL014486, partial [Ladona fulva]